MAKVEDLIGKTLVAIVGAEKGSEEIIFKCSDGKQYSMHHDQDCCESVNVEDICGDIKDLIGTPIIKASEDTSGENPEDIVKEYQDSFTWTFYNFATVKGYVTIRWYGESTGYYSESVNFEEAKVG